LSTEKYVTCSVCIGGAYRVLALDNVAKHVLRNETKFKNKIIITKK